MATEEEQNRHTATAEIILPDAARQAALAAGAKGSAARPAEDILTGYKTVVAEGVTSPLGLAEAALDLSFEWAKPPASTPLTLVSNRDDVEMEALEARRQTAISALRNAIAKAEDGERDNLERALEQLESAKNPGEIQAALTVAQSTLSREAAGGGSKAAGADMADINSRHKELYASDSIYRREMDRITAEGDKDRTAADARDKKIDAMLKQHGISTSADGDLDSKRRQREEARRRGDLQEVAKLDAEINVLRLQQLEEARREAERRGLTDVVTTLDNERRPREDEHAAARRRYDEATRAYLEAHERNINNNPSLTPAERASRIEFMREAIRRQRQQVLGDDSLEAINEAVRTRISETEEERSAEGGARQTPAPGFAPERREGGETVRPSATNEPQPGAGGRFIVAEASRGATLTPPATPAAGTAPDLPDLPG